MPAWAVTRRTAVSRACLAVTLIAGCGMPAPPEAARDPSEAGPGGRHQPLGMSPEQELEVGRRAYRQVMRELEDGVLPESSGEVRRVRQVTARLVKAAAIEPLQREINLRVRGYRFEWEANVVRSKEVNAFCLPAGKIFVFTGILQVASESDDQLAAVLSHEIAHALAHHGSERVARAKSGRAVLRNLSYDRMQESEADKIGVFLMAFADYEPAQAAVFWQRMSQLRGGGGGMPEFLSDHPSPESRARDLKQWAADARAAKRAYDRGDIAPPPGR